LPNSVSGGQEGRDEVSIVEFIPAIE